MDLRKFYETLQVDVNATDEQISASYKRLAQLLHPDKNPAKVEWATEAMKNLNLAYSMVMSSRFTERSSEDEDMTGNGTEETDPEKVKKNEDIGNRNDSRGLKDEILIKKFVRFREAAKDVMYRYFQYGLHVIPKREQASNRSIYNEIVYVLRRSYHAINMLSKDTEDRELLEHFSVFNKLVFNFYKASECINIIDSYKDTHEVHAYRMYMRGDEKLHYAHKEVFFDRHNRGTFKFDVVHSLIREANEHFHDVVTRFPESSWVVEARIKIEYIASLKKYLYLFFSEE